MNKHYKSAPWDSQNSTFKSVIYFRNGKTIPGYSKRQGFQEVANKQALVQNWVLRLYRDGYLDNQNARVDEVECIEFSVRSKGDYTHAFTLYQTYVEWNPDFYRDYLNDFFSNFYSLKRDRKDPYELLYISTKSKKADPLDLSRHRFYTTIDLKNHCIRLIESNIRALGEVRNFYIKYSQKYFNGFNEQDLTFFDHLTGSIMSTNVD
ncbi:MAG: hypothetical protein NXI20_16755 [bacterium]|nr:hypothetical protein [bacterium]